MRNTVVGAALLPLALLCACAAGPRADRTDGPVAAAAATQGCTVDVIVRFAPYVAAPSSQALAAELVQGSGYHLRYVRSLGAAHLLRLTGPDSTCDDGLALLKREPRVESVEIDERQYRHMTK